MKGCIKVFNENGRQKGVGVMIQAIPGKVFFSAKICNKRPERTLSDKRVNHQEG